MDTEVELLEPQEHWDKEIPIQAELVTTQVPIQQIIINNEVQNIMGDAHVLICPKCRLIIQQFQPGVPEVEIHKSLCTDKEEALNHTMYCKKCGQKLKVFRPAPVEGTYVIKESTR